MKLVILFLVSTLTMGSVAFAQTTKQTINQKLKTVIAPAVEKSLRTQTEKANDVIKAHEKLLSEALQRVGKNMITLPRLPKLQTTSMEFRTLNLKTEELDFAFEATFSNLGIDGAPEALKPALNVKLDYSKQDEAVFSFAATTGFELQPMIRYLGSKSLELMEAINLEDTTGEEKKFLEVAKNVMQDLSKADSDEKIIYETAEKLEKLRTLYIDLAGLDDGKGTLETLFGDIIKALNIFPLKALDKEAFLAGVELDSDDLQDLGDASDLLNNYVKSFSLGLYLASKDHQRTFKEGMMDLQRGGSFHLRGTFDVKSDTYVDILGPLKKETFKAIDTFANTDELDQKVTSWISDSVETSFSMIAEYFVNLTDVVIDSHEK